MNYIVLLLWILAILIWIIVFIPTNKKRERWLSYPNNKPVEGLEHLVTLSDQDWIDVVVAEYEDGDWYSRFNGEKITSKVVAFWTGKVPDAYYPA